ncbi:MAG: tetratricopeptide repeat protein [Ignavibacteria bacterium]|nr:tetratricopeptide repeat protein [Ignavibacteria bacterium]
MANGKRSSRVSSSSSAGFSFIPYTLYPIPLFLVIFFLSIPIYAQRSEINDGVDQYKEEKYTDAEVNFKKGKEKAPERFEAHFNLGDAYYKQGRYDESLKEFYSSLELSENPELKAKAYHNIGNSLLKSQKIKESIEAYKNALKITPNDLETKYNLSYALNQLEKQQNQQQQNQQNQNQDQNKDKNQQNDKNDQQQNEQNKPDQNEQTQQDNTKAQQQNQISKEEAERILQALKNNEQDIQKKIRKKTGVAVKREKDW